MASPYGPIEISLRDDIIPYYGHSGLTPLPALLIVKNYNFKISNEL